MTAPESDTDLSSTVNDANEPNPGGDERKHVVVLGGGFAGLELCKHLRNPRCRITLVDRQNHHLFQPLLYQVATAGLAAPDIAQPLRSIVGRRPELEVVMDQVEHIDLDRRQVRCRRQTLAYDYLAITLGVRTSYFGHPGWEKFAPGLKSLGDATEIRRRVLTAFELAETEPDPAARQQLMTVVVVGGGPTGVELAGAFAELTRKVLRHDFRRINPTEARIVLVEGTGRLLSTYSDSQSDYTRRTLERMGVTVRTSAMVDDLGEGYVRINGEIVRTANVIWAAGMQAPSVIAALDIAKDRAGRLKVLPDLSLPGHPEVFAAGDLVHLTRGDGRPVPGIAPAAMQMGRHVAGVISYDLSARVQPGAPEPPRDAFEYFDKGSMATIGRSAAVAETMGLRFNGFPAWLAWLFIHLVFLVGLRNRLQVFINWCWAYITFRSGARIITGASPGLPTAATGDPAVQARRAAGAPEHPEP